MMLLQVLSADGSEHHYICARHDGGMNTLVGHPGDGIHTPCNTANITYFVRYITDDTSIDSQFTLLFQSKSVSDLLYYKRNPSIR